MLPAHADRLLKCFYVDSASEIGHNDLCRSLKERTPSLPTKVRKVSLRHVELWFFASTIIYSFSVNVNPLFNVNPRGTSPIAHSLQLT